MSYRDPYAAQYGSNQYQNYGQGYEFNPYSSQQQQFPTYGQSGAYTDNYYNGGFRDEPSQLAGQQSQGNTRMKDIDETSGFDRGEFPVKDETLRLRRRDYQVNLWTQGGRGRCCGRFCCCTLMIALFLFISIVLALALWIRPPSVTVGDAEIRDGATGGAFSSNITVPLQINISVNNPNYFSVKLKKLEAEFTYPLGNTPLGNGRLDNVNLDSGRETNFTFPFQIEYKFSDDPSLVALRDIADKCGITSNQKSNLNVQYKIKVGLQIIAATISPSISNTINFACPFSQEAIDKIRAKLGPFIGGSSG